MGCVYAAAQSRTRLKRLSSSSTETRRPWLQPPQSLTPTAAEAPREAASGPESGLHAHHMSRVLAWKKSALSETWWPTAVSVKLTSGVPSEVPAGAKLARAGS